MNGRKKLLTLAGVVGILACGACFLPPLPQHKPVPPPIRFGLDGVQSIRVEVANASSSHYLDSAALERKIADAINEQSWKTKVSAHVGKEAGGEDAVLNITVLSETVEPAPAAETGRLTFVIKDSATLTRLNGALLWRETEAGNWLMQSADNEEHAAAAWKVPGFLNQVDKELSDRVVFRMFYGR
jgi:hypothetical protein